MITAVGMTNICLSLYTITQAQIKLKPIMTLTIKQYKPNTESTHKDHQSSHKNTLKTLNITVHLKAVL